MKQWIAAFILLAGAITGAVAQSPYSTQQFGPIVMTGSAQTSAAIPLGANGRSGSWAAGAVTLTGTSLTTATIAALGSSDGGTTYYPIGLAAYAVPGTITNTVTATGNTLYLVSLVGLTHIKFVTSGTFTATSISILVTAAPNGTASRGGGGGGGGGGAPSGPASGDLAGSYPSPSVAGIGGVPLCNGLAPTAGQVLQYTTGGSPSPCYSALTPAGGAPSGPATGDLAGTYPSPSVKAIAGVPLCTGFTPTTGQVLQYTTGGTPSPCYSAATPSGTGTVQSVAVTTANGFSCTVANPTTTANLTCVLGAITPTSVAATGDVSGASLSAGTGAAPCPSATVGGCIALQEYTSGYAATTGQGVYILNAADHLPYYASNGGTLTQLAVTISKGQATLATAAIASGACATAVTATATGADPTSPNYDILKAAFASDPRSITGYTPTANGVLTIYAWLSANTVNFSQCNFTAASVTPQAVVLNWRVER